MRSSSGSRKKRGRSTGRASSNRRRHRRLRVDRAVRVPVQVFPVLPFVGPALEGALMNLSPGGMALLIEGERAGERLTRHDRLRVHFRLPGLPLTECRGTVTHAVQQNDGWMRLGVKFLKTPPRLGERIKRMIFDDQVCDDRIVQDAQPRCDLACTFHSLCHKPIRQDVGSVPAVVFEIALQRA